VTGTDPEYRTITAEWLGIFGNVQNVKVVSDTGDFSFPRIGDIGLVVQETTQAYYLGKIEYDYKSKIDGKYTDPDTEATVFGKRVLEGEIFIGNLLQRVWMSITSAGDFSFLSGLNEGLRYYCKERILKLSGMTTRLVGNGVTFNLGSVIRDNSVVQEVPLVPAVEAFMEVLFSAIRIVRFHLGNIKDSLGVDELSSLGEKLRAVLEVKAGPAVVASLKMDEKGNIELTSLAGKILIDTSIIQGILLGGLSSVYRALLGEPFLLHYKAHTHSTAMGPSGPIIVPVVDESVLSQKVKLL
jgi:hypothetical protein